MAMNRLLPTLQNSRRVAEKNNLETAGMSLMALQHLSKSTEQLNAEMLLAQYVKERDRVWEHRDLIKTQNAKLINYHEGLMQLETEKQALLNRKENSIQILDSWHNGIAEIASTSNGIKKLHQAFQAQIENNGPKQPPDAVIQALGGLSAINLRLAEIRGTQKRFSRLIKAHYERRHNPGVGNVVAALKEVRKGQENMRKLKEVIKLNPTAHAILTKLEGEQKLQVSSKRAINQPR